MSALVAALLGLAVAAPVSCDPAEATAWLADSGLPPARAPEVLPHLLPGLARARSEPDALLRTALEALCELDGELVLERRDVVDLPEFTAWSFDLRSRSQRGCGLVESGLSFSVAATDGRLSWSLVALLPDSFTPIGDCAEPARWRDERVLALSDRVRVVELVDAGGPWGAPRRVVARRATPFGWREDVLSEGPDQGARWVVTRSATRDVLVVRTGATTEVGGRCAPLGGQEVFVAGADGWTRAEGREAAGILAAAGEWRLAAEDGWFVILGQDDEEDESVVLPRKDRLQRRISEPLSVVRSSSFPGFNGGYLLITAAPWPTEEEAAAARDRWGRRASSYVKRGWEALDPCGPAPGG